MVLVVFCEPDIVQKGMSYRKVIAIIPCGFYYGKRKDDGGDQKTKSPFLVDEGKEVNPVLVQVDELKDPFDFRQTSFFLCVARFLNNISSLPFHNYSVRQIV